MRRPFLGHANFDHYAADYDAALAKGLRLTGETKDYFATRRVLWLARCLHGLDEHPRSAMDFGCGTGASVRLLGNLIGVHDVTGVDVSRRSLELAKRDSGSERTEFFLFEEYRPSERIDLVFCNGVFHHISPMQRSTIVNYIYRALRPGGLFAVWENNPWNLGARYVMSRIPFDRDAIMLRAAEMRRLLRASSFKILRTDSLFIFPKVLSCLRGLEPLVSRLSLGAQYQVLCRKLPANDREKAMEAR